MLGDSLVWNKKQPVHVPPSNTLWVDHSKDCTEGGESDI